MEEIVNGEFDDNRVYCPCCGLGIAEHLTGVLKRPCTRCKAKLKIIVNDYDYSIFCLKTRRR